MSCRRIISALISIPGSILSGPISPPSPIFSARVQSVSKRTNQRYWRLIDAFKQRTGCGTIVNTSFNVRGEPIVLTPEDAYRCFMRTEMDYLVIDHLLFDKKRQNADRNHDWKQEAFAPD